MPETTSLIKNPLTIIAAFATLAEVSGTAVLPLINNDNQFYFMCFLMFFPTVLILLFFGTLNFNHHVLYAPSDFRNEDNYFKRLAKSSPSELSEKAQEEAREIQIQNLGEQTSVSEPTREITKVPSDNLEIGFTPINELRSSYERAEQLALRKLARDWPRPIMPQMTLQLDNGKRITMDAISMDGKDVTVFETKYYKSDIVSPIQIKTALKNLRKRYEQIPAYVAQHISVVLVVVTHHKIPESIQNHVISSIKYDSNIFNHLGRIIFYNIAELEEEFGPATQKAS